MWFWDKPLKKTQKETEKNVLDAIIILRNGIGSHFLCVHNNRKTALRCACLNSFGEKYVKEVSVHIEKW